MTQIGELERLAALRAQGALSDSEFAAAKAALLKPPKYQRLLLVLAGCTVAIATVIVAASATRWPLFSDRPSVSTRFEQPKIPIQMVTPSPPPKTILPGSSKLQQVFRRELLGAQITFLEQIVGPPRNVDEPLRTYDVDGCDLYIKVERGAIASISIPYLTNKCTVSLEDFGLSSKPADQLTFRIFEGVSNGTIFTADCLRLCGNAADPSVYATVSTPRSNGAIQFRAGVVLVGHVAYGASAGWSDAMDQAEGENFVDLGRFNCDFRYSDVAKNTFRNVKITSIEIGRIEPTLSC